MPLILYSPFGINTFLFAFVTFLWTYCNFPPKALMSLSHIPINIFHMLKKSIPSFPLKTVLLGAFHPSTPIQMCCFIFESHLQFLSDVFLFYGLSLFVFLQQPVKKLYRESKIFWDLSIWKCLYFILKLQW